VLDLGSVDHLELAKALQFGPATKSLAPSKGALALSKSKFLETAQ
jgi:hypothetical protein